MASRGVNKVILIGNLGRIQKSGPCLSGGAVANLTPSNFRKLARQTNR